MIFVGGRRWAGRLAAGWLSLQLLGCSSWREERVIPIQQALERTPSQLRVDIGEKRQVVIQSPRLVDGLISGLASNPRVIRSPADSLHIHLSTVTGYATRRLNIARTIGAGLASVVGVTLFITVATCANRNCIP